ncbi:MAG: PilZ domain-containing protein [Treponema sp.]|nr:PilZ domain-containing protein [Treponema sp.]
MPILVIIIALGVGIFLFSRFGKEVGGSWATFFAKGKEAGFSLKEIEMLRQLAVQCNLDDPVSLFLSQAQLDTCIQTVVRSMKMSGESDDQGIHDFLSRLYDYRKKMEMDKRGSKDGLFNTRQISEGQVLKIMIPDAKDGFSSQVIRNVSQYMTVSRPVNSRNSTASSWQGSKISVYFWKEDDAGYAFDTRVLDQIYSKGISSLKIAHSESLSRVQKRNSIRVKMHEAAFLYLAHDGEPLHRLENEPGLKCFLEDLSDTGCAVVVGGKADDKLRVKVQFALDSVPVCMTGTVRSTRFDEETNRSVLHIEAESLPIEIRNHILGEVFGKGDDGEGENSPPRPPDNKAASVVAPGVSPGAMPDGTAGGDRREAAGI